MFNLAHPSIQFTSELENNGSFKFLDVQIWKRPDGSVRRSVYRKPTWSGQYTHFNSFVPLRQKRNLVKTLTHRARQICSTDMLDAELNHIVDVLKENGYPDRFVRRNMIIQREIKPTQTAERKPIYLSLPFRVIKLPVSSTAVSIAQRKEFSQRPL